MTGADSGDVLLGMFVAVILSIFLTFAWISHGGTAVDYRIDRIAVEKYGLVTVTPVQGEGQ